MSKWNGKSCPVCGAGTLHDGKKAMDQYYRGHCYSSEITGAFCDHCGDGVVDFDPAEEERWLAFCRQVDAQEAAELVRIRKKLKLSQAKAARLAGGGKNAFSRYERGQAKPVAAVTNLFKLLDKHPELIKELQ
ncbi:type II toxin-antitoxin system MqsA family antitoxin [Nitrosomonas sp.]|uniref:type II toxin-antitoxin system MqsA family antitoxin n=1 Tax=Nitrosomonas sp. TaxID=42353 RepID=UPI00248E09E1|nr:MULTISPECIES: type II toxin-antitoxin system MqsA family antitoxin [Nitrosomonas]MCW5600440.1 type II toxin-antitoxin system MqsA family antitoxin [Nitrosomonas sp.]